MPVLLTTAHTYNTGHSTLPQRSIFWSKNNIYFPPPFRTCYFPPFHETSFLDYYRALFALILSYVAFFWPVYFPFLFTFPRFFLFLSPFFFFLWYFPLFLFPFSHFSPQKTSADIPLPRGGGIFQYLDPCPTYKSPELRCSVISINHQSLCTLLWIQIRNCWLEVHQLRDKRSLYGTFLIHKHYLERFKSKFYQLKKKWNRQSR